MLLAHAPDSFEDAGPYPGLESQVTGTAGAILAWDHLPLAAGPQDIENAVEDRTVRHAWPTVGPGRLVGRQHGFDQVPQGVGNLAESVPPLRFSSHRVSSMTTMLSSVLTTNPREGFRTHS